LTTPFKKYFSPPPRPYLKFFLTSWGGGEGEFMFEKDGSKGMKQVVS